MIVMAHKILEGHDFVILISRRTNSNLHESAVERFEKFRVLRIDIERENLTMRSGSLKIILFESRISYDT